MIYKYITEKKYEYCSVNMRHYKDGENELNTLGQEGWVAVGVIQKDSTPMVLMMREFTEIEHSEEQING